jgi:hypothetical protein
LDAPTVGEDAAGSSAIEDVGLGGVVNPAPAPLPLKPFPPLPSATATPIVQAVMEGVDCAKSSMSPALVTLELSM